MSETMDDLKAEVQRLNERVAFLETRLEHESTGRTRAEKALRSKFMEETGGVGKFKAVGTIDTCFKTRFGTPRQGSLAGLTRGTIKLDRTVISPDALTGLGEFSHIWVVFVFHENTNMHKLVKDEDTPHHKKKTKLFPAFVKPPQMGGKKLGLFATRSPHRPNPIGLTLIRVSGVDIKKGTIDVRGIDLVDGTPILDIKPYIPHVDNPLASSPPVEVNAPSWLVNPKFEVVPVQFTAEAMQNIDELCASGASSWFGCGESKALRDALEEVIQLDPRGVIHGRGNFKSEASNPNPNNIEAKDLKTHLFRDSFVFDFDEFRIRFHPHESERAIVVYQVNQKGNGDA
eukprot:CAMPEP_0203751266 /NCGR_PEP_ID=MMETSP0098-20131031/5360_1 /ASSEMBLY_ACC=CAM_ASM_000208 /TAXON_ID=96639 /ORGANISM=" , Strain NY0313808BC1" /LENGTH=343 /DNA_ID=CAMNT_0050640901 /DNA_START=207 /DNA_END=1238 /DNA_ORIENTATION=+